MIRIFFLLTLLIPVSLCAQKYIDKPRNEVKMLLQKDLGTDRLVETDSTLEVSPRMNEEAKQVTYIYGFDSEGKCQYERVTTICRECFERTLNAVIGQSVYEWKKINENQYVSKFSDKLLLEISPEENEYYFNIFRANWTKEMYDMLKGNK